MLTIFSIPKPFIGHSEIIQRNAVQSWLRLEPHCEIILCGDEFGAADIALEYNISHIPDIAKSDYGTPLLSSAFQAVHQKAGNSLICYVNTDIIILNNMIDAVRVLSFQKYLLLGQRWNLDINDPIDYELPTWEKELREKLANEGELQPPFGSDYFVFPKEVHWVFPEFAVGRPGWDNWIIYRARALKMPVVDATEVAIVIHQNHGYVHVPEGIDSTSFEGPEANINRDLMGGEDYSFNCGDATFRLTRKSLKRALDYRYLKFRVMRQPVLVHSRGSLIKILWRFLYALLYRRKYFPKWFWQNLVYFLTK